MTLPIDRDYILATLQDIVRIDSINPGLIPGSAGEGELAAYLADALRAIGLEVDVSEPLPGRPNVVGILRGNGGGRSLMLNGHTDTVGVDGMDAPFSAEVRDGKLYGRGAYDMKASLAAMLGAAKAFVDSGEKLAGDLLLAMVVDEEFHNTGTQAIVESHPVDGAIVTEPTGLRVCVAHRGFWWFDVETIGRAAHGSRYQDGIDANRLMGYFLVELDKHAAELLQCPPHELLGPPSIHAPLIKGGSSQSVYAARCLTELERRLLPGETPEQIVQDLQTILDRLTETVPNFRGTVKQGFGRQAFEVSSDAAIVQTVVDACQQQLGAPPELYGELWWMDSALLAQAGVETVIIGPKGAGAHADEEWVDLESVYELAHILVRASQRYCDAPHK